MCKLLFDVFELTNNCMQLTRTHQRYCLGDDCCEASRWSPHNRECSSCWPDKAARSKENSLSSRKRRLDIDEKNHFRRVKDFLELTRILILWRAGHKGFPDTKWATNKKFCSKTFRRLRHVQFVNTCHSFASCEPMFSYFGQKVQDKPRKLLFQASKVRVAIATHEKLWFYSKPTFQRGLCEYVIVHTISVWVAVQSSWSFL